MSMKPTSLADALFSKVQQQVLGLLFVNAQRSFYTNEIVRFVNSGVGVVQRELEKLVEAGLITFKKIGNQKHYQANPNTPIYSELRSIMLKTVGLADIVRLALLPYSDRVHAAFIYGSVAEGRDTAKSDIDVFIIGEELTYADIVNALSEHESKLGRPVNPSIYSLEEIKRKLHNHNAFISRVLEQPKIFLIGSQDDLPTS